MSFHTWGIGMELCRGCEEMDFQDCLQDARFQLVTLQRQMCVACLHSQQASEAEGVILNCVFNSN